MLDKEEKLAKFYIIEFEFLLQECNFLMSEEQKQRLHNQIEQFNVAINENRRSDLESCCQKAQLELNNLMYTDDQKISLIGFVILSRDAISFAYQKDQTKANSMATKLSQMLDAMKRNDGHEVDRLIQELQREVSVWITQFSSENKEVTTDLPKL